MGSIRVYCVRDGRVYRREFEDHREARDYAIKQELRGYLCFISG